MPLFDMYCGDCGYEGEHLIRRNEAVDCPEGCESTLEQRAVQAFAISRGRTSTGAGRGEIFNGPAPGDKLRGFLAPGEIDSQGNLIVDAPEVVSYKKPDGSNYTARRVGSTMPDMFSGGDSSDNTN